MNYTFIIVVSCSDDSLFIDPTLGCVCAVGYSQTAAGTHTTAPECTPCPAGTTTTGANSQELNACGKNRSIGIPIDWHQCSLSTEMSHNILIPFYYTFISVINNAKSHLVKFAECIIDNNLSILLIIELHIYYCSILLRSQPFH